MSLITLGVQGKKKSIRKSFQKQHFDVYPTIPKVVKLYEFHLHIQKKLKDKEVS